MIFGVFPLRLHISCAMWCPTIGVEFSIAGSAFTCGAQCIRPAINAELLAANIPLAIGSDSNTRLDPIEELRWAESMARMRYQRRHVLLADELASPGPLLLHYGMRSGAAALHTTICPI